MKILDLRQFKYNNPRAVKVRDIKEVRISETRSGDKYIGEVILTMYDGTDIVVNTFTDIHKPYILYEEIIDAINGQK